MGTNAELVAIFQEIADLLDLTGEKFKPEAYRRAARSIESLTEDLRSVAGRGELDSIPGVGEAIAEKIQEYLRTGHLAYFETLRAQFPPGVLEMMQLPGIGPKTARRFWKELGAEGPAELAAAIEAGRLVGMAGFGPRKIALVQQAVASATSPTRRMPLPTAFVLAERIVGELTRTAPVDRIAVAGSLRRRRESIGDLDLLVTSAEAEKVFDAFSALADVKEVRLRGPTKETVLLHDGVQVDLRVLDPDEFGAALQYFTGSKDHNVHLRSLARDQGLKINEYGVFRGEERIASRTEADVYATLRLPYIPAEIREDRGEIEAAAAGTLPELVDTTDLVGDLHVHVGARASASELHGLIDGARARRWAYLGVVVDGPSTGEGANSPATERVLGRLRELGGDSLQIFHGLEFPVTDFATAAAAPSAGEYVLLRAEDATPPPPPGTAATPEGPAVLTHLVTGPLGGASDLTLATGWVRWAAAAHVALEVAPTGCAGGIDGPAIRRAMELGADLHLTVGPAAGTVGDLAVGIARRGWGLRARVLNARPMRPAGRPPAPPRVRRR